jgi:hypothetical protein
MVRAVDLDQLRFAGDLTARLSGGLDGNGRVLAAVDDQCRRGDPASVRAPAAGRTPRSAAAYRSARHRTASAWLKAVSNPEFISLANRMLTGSGLHITAQPAIYEVVVDLHPGQRVDGTSG